MEFIEIDFATNRDVSEIVKLINMNHYTSEKMVKEIKKLEIEKEQKSFINNIEEDESTLIEETSDELITNESFINEVDYYSSLLNSITTYTNLEERVKTVLPSIKKSNYSNIILRLKLEILKNIKDINELIYEEKENLEKDDLEDLKHEVILEKKKMDIINNDMCKEESDDNISFTNNLIFVPTSGGNIRVLEEIEKIDSEYYEGFRGLFNSIKDGTFKNVKRFHSTNNKSSGVTEVKDYKIRVVFDRIGENDFALITAFVKKSDNDKGYIAPLELKIKNYMNQRDKIKENLDNPEFRTLNGQYCIELENILNGKIDDNNKSYRRER